MSVSKSFCQSVEAANMSRLTLLFALASLFSKYEASKILTVIPTAAISHQVVYRPLIQELVRRGHEVVVLTTDPVYPKGQAPANLTEIDLHDISYEVWRKQVSAMENGDRHVLKKQVKDSSRVCFDIFLMQVKLPEVQDIIKNQNHTFDLIIVETWARFALGFSHVIKAPVISFNSFGGIWDSYNIIGAPSHPFLYPISLQTRIHNLTIWDKLLVYYDLYLIMHQHNNEKEEYENDGLRTIFGEHMPPLSELQNNIDMLFLNIHPIFEGIRPVPPGVVYVGGLHQNPQKELPEAPVIYGPLIQEFVRRGHEVVVLTTDPAYPKGQAPANLTEINLHDISYEVLRKHANG